MGTINTTDWRDDHHWNHHRSRLSGFESMTCSSSSPQKVCSSSHLSLKKKFGFFSFQGISSISEHGQSRGTAEVKDSKVTTLPPSLAEAHGQITGFKHNSFKGYETEAEARKAYATYLKKCDGSSSEEFDRSHDQQPLAHQLKIALEERDKLKEELDDLLAKLGALALG
ncbi:hypothetical protein RHSIM_RhsimUnG0058900 [Rhododendron simsii]|uniref:Uncharacterized protein n=1 Tax=Rhododendron simsii TaxID=118357 RepID=A0A834FZ84_RHOSS|nr:hypothetical protein RHSIM_RhsimUnG0058900 [Rhododendron simsii]